MAVTLEQKQERIVRTLEGPLFVSAGAGSGKTFTLTQRVLYALTPGSKPREQWADPAVPEPFLESIDQVLAITFTDKAAQELKERIRAGLVDAGMPAEAERVDAAWISTIHGMCSRIIRAHALDLGVDPAFTVAGYADDLKRRAVEHVVRRVAAEEALAEAGVDAGAGAGVDAGTGAAGAAAELGAADPSAADAAAARTAYAALLGAFTVEAADGAAPGATNLLSILMAILAKASATVDGLAAFEQVAPAPSYVELYEAYRDIAEAPSFANAEDAGAAVAAIEVYLASPRDLPALRACYAGCGALSLTGRGMGKDEKSFVRAVRAARPRFFAEAYLACRADALAELMPLAREVAREYAALKRERAVLDNDDLLTLAYDALAHDERVRASFAGRFKMVMVDEFQDTAQQQVELVRLLCSPDCRELCCVGDAQQSIYRFRGADVSVFRTMKAEVERGGRGAVLDLDRNFRSHAAILGFADRIFGGGAENRLGRDFLHLESCGEATRRGARALTPSDPEDETVGTSRCQAVLAVGGTADDRAAAKAAAIAARFRRLRDEEGFRPGEMVILMARLTKADVYAEAVRAAGMPCVVAGGTSVFRRAPEVGVIRALLNFLANTDDGEEGVTPLITSPMLGLGATELVALATCVNAETGIVDTRTITGEVLLSGEIMEDFGSLPLLERARAVLGQAVARVGRDPLSAIARDAVVASGWLARLEAGGAQERAVAANVLKALAIVEEVEAAGAYAPRLVARAFADHIDHVKESPAVLSGADEDAVRIMTVHASKGLEFPVVAVAECDGIRAGSDRFQMCDRAGKVLWSALPNRFDPASDADLLKDLPEPDEDDYEHVPPRAAEAFAFMRREAASLDYDEAARLLYVAITRAREVVVLAMGARFATELVPGHATSLVGEVLVRILPPSDELPGLPDLGADRLDLPDAHSGDYQLVLFDDLLYPTRKNPHVAYAAEDYPCFFGGPVAAEDAAGEEPAEREVLLVEPAPVGLAVTPASPAPRLSYSYTSLAAALHEAAEDRAAGPATAADADAVVVAGGEGGDRAAADADAAAVTSRDGAGAGAAAADDPTALGSAFHAAAQWLVETGAETVPAARVDALARYWGVSAAQRVRLDAALARWERSAVRAAMRAWPQVRAEVPFFALGAEDLADTFGPFVEGAIDVLCTDPTRPGEAFVIDYKTGGSSEETPDELQKKHELQARVYADVLKRAGFEQVSFAFVRVEVPDPADPDEPQVVTYRF